MPYRFFEKQSNGSLIELNLEGQYQGEEFGVQPLSISTVGDPVPPLTPLAPVINAGTTVLTTRTSATINWAAPNNTGRPPITDYRIYRQDDGGAEAYIGHTGSASTLTYVDSPVPTNTPEIVFTYIVRAVNADGIGAPSSGVNVQWGSVVTSPPAAPTNLQQGTLTSSSVALTWEFPADASVTKQAIYNNNTLLVDNIDPASVAYVWSGLTPGTSYSAINIRRYNSAGWSGASNTVAFVVPQPSSGSFYGHQPGLIYVGFSTDVNYNQAITEIGSDVDVYRIFNPTDSGKIGSCYTRSTKMIPWVSIKPTDLGLPQSNPDITDWNSIAAGNQDTQIRNLADSLLSYVQGSNKSPMVLTFHHEPVGPDRSATAGNAYTAAFSRIIDLFKARPTWNDRILFGPCYEEFTFRSGATPDWTVWCKSSFMNKCDFFGFDMYQFASNNTNNGAALRIGRIKSMLTSRGYADMPLGVGECGGRQEAFGYEVDPSRWTSAQYGRQWVNYLESDDQFWIVSFYNATDVGNSRLTQPAIVPPDTETYMNTFRDILSSGAHLATLGIT